jgi:hypothetical protein
MKATLKHAKKPRRESNNSKENKMDKRKLVELAMELARISEDRKDAEQREKELKELFKQEFGEGQHAVGDYIVSIAERSRTDIDREKLKEDLGIKAKKYERNKSYLALEIKRKP